MRRIAWTTIAISALLLPEAARASWLSKITGVHVNLNGGPVLRIEAPQPQAIPEMLQNLPKDAAQAILSPHGTVLAAAIRHARGQIRPASEPIPPQIRERLAPFFPANILDKARWKMRNDAKWALDTAVMKISGPGAITVDDVIIFNDNINPASADLGTLELWAHELTHVVQYENMGVESFAFIYSYKPGELEDPAYQNAGQIKVRLAQGGGQTNPYFTTSYASTAAIGTQQIAMPQLQQSAMQFVPPANCVIWQTNQIGAVIQNICAVPVRVTGWTQQNPWTGQFVSGPCAMDCAVLPGIPRQFVSMQQGLWVDVGFAF